MILNLAWRRVEFANFPEVSMELKPLDFKSFQTVMGLIAGIGSGQEAAKAFSKVDISSVVEEIFPQYIRNVSGIQIKEGDDLKTVEVKDLSSSGAFVSICMEIMAKLLDISKLGGDDEKKSEDLLLD